MKPIESVTSGKQTVSALMKTGGGFLSSILIVTNGSADASVVVYDNTAASGTQIFEATVAGADNQGFVDLFRPIKFSTGLFVSLTGTGAAFYVYTGQ